MIKGRKMPKKNKPTPKPPISIPVMGVISKKKKK